MHTPSPFQRNDGNLHSVIRHVVRLAIPHYILFVACSVNGELCSIVPATCGQVVQVRCQERSAAVRPVKVVQKTPAVAVTHHRLSLSLWAVFIATDSASMMWVGYYCLSECDQKFVEALFYETHAETSTPCNVVPQSSPLQCHSLARCSEHILGLLQWVGRGSVHHCLVFLSCYKGRLIEF